MDAVLGELPTGILVYCCGPAGMVDAAGARCASWADPEAMRFELLAAPEDLEIEGERPFEVEPVHAGMSFVV